MWRVFGAPGRGSLQGLAVVICFTHCRGSQKQRQRQLEIAVTVPETCFLLVECSCSSCSAVAFPDTPYPFIFPSYLTRKYAHGNHQSTYGHMNHPIAWDLFFRPHDPMQLAVLLTASLRAFILEREAGSGREEEAI